MADATLIKAAARPRSGKGGARAVRREGKIPGIVYGNGEAPQTVALDHNELWKLVQKGRFLQTVFELDIDGRKGRVLPRDVQLDPVKDIPLHVDFQRVGIDTPIRVNVPVRFFNEASSPGLKRGGVLNVVRHQIEVICPANRIPAYFEVNLEGLEIGRSVHISAIKLPAGVQPTIRDRDFTVATIAGAASAKPEVEEGVPGAVPTEEGEVPEGEEAAAAAAAAEGKGAAAPGAKAGAAPAGKAGAAPAGKGGTEAAKPAAAEKKPADKKK